MIRVEVEEYCQSCLDFEPDVTKPEKVYGDDNAIVLSDTVIRCKYRKRCQGITRYLEHRVKGETVG